MDFGKFNISETVIQLGHLRIVYLDILFHVVQKFHKL